MTRTAELYTVWAEGEWAFIVLDEATGLFLSHGSFGTYGHVWPARGEGVTLKAFLRGLDMHYFMGKTRSGDWLVFDPDATIAEMRRELIDRRRQDELTRAEARAAWNALADLGHYTNEGQFVDRVLADPDLGMVWSDSYYDLGRHVPIGDASGFWTIIWPHFLDMIRDLAAEAETLRAAIDHALAHPDDGIAWLREWSEGDRTAMAELAAARAPGKAAA